MVDVLGHIAVGLLWTIPAWIVWERRRSLVFVGVSLLSVLVPDIDLYIPGLEHHGPTHTILFVAAVALVGGAVLAAFAARWSGRSGRSAEFQPSVYGFVTAALLVGGLSHVFVDLLSTSAAGQPLNPFWPFFQKPFHLYVIHRFSAPIWNGIPLLGGLVVHLNLFLINSSAVSQRSSASG